MAPMTSAVKRDHEDDDYSDDDSAGDSGDDYSMDAQSSGLRRRGRLDGAADYSVMSPGYSSTDSGGASNHAGGPGAIGASGSAPRRATGPRKPRSSVPLTPEEEERRRLRRERNKFAAAKCRQKRVDLTNSLLEETQSLEAEQQRLQDEIKSYQQEKEELEFILEAHRLHCGVDTGLGPPTNSLGTSAESATLLPSTQQTTVPPAAYALPVVKVEDSTSEPVILQISQTVTGPKITSLQPASAATSLAGSSTLSGIMLGQGILQTSADSEMKTVVTTAYGSKVQVMHKRPSSLGTNVKSGKSLTSTTTTLADAANVFVLGLDSMIDGHTGLTPITGMPAAVPLLATPSTSVPVTSIGTPGDSHLGGPENLSSKVPSGSNSSSTRSIVTL